MTKHPQVVSMFENSIKNNRLSHLYLLNGLKGSGKKRVANYVASRLFGMEYAELIEKGHINLFYIEPDGVSIKTSQIEQLQQEFYKTSLVDGYRIYIIDKVDKLTLKAANQLLKFLEEPVSKVSLGFLLTDNLEMVIDTIKSRSQIINLPAPSEISLTEKLLKEDFDLFMAELIPYLDKNIDNLREMRNNANIKVLLDNFKNYLEALTKKENMWLYANSHLHDIKYDKEQLNYFLQLLLVFYIDLYNYKEDNELKITSLKEIYLKYDISLKELKVQLTNIQEIIKMLNYNVNVDLAFNNYLLKV